MSHLRVIEEFDALPRLLGDGERFAIRPIGQHACHIGKSTAGEPALLIEVQQAPPRDRPAPIVLEHVRVQHDVDCLVQRPDETMEPGRFTLIRCTDSDRLMQEYFLLSVSSVVLAMDQAPSRADVVQAIATLVELFRSMTQVPRKSIQGLWAELYVLAQGPNPAAAIPHWHNHPEDRYDFNAGVQRVEVKSAAGRLRSHHFSLEQLRPPAGTQVWVASLFVESASGGTSVMELFDEVRAEARGNTILLLHLDRVLRMSLGNAWRQAFEDRFDRQLAEESLRFFRAEEIPAIESPLPAEISEVHMRVDLTNLTPVETMDSSETGGLFEAVSRSR